eukprot:15084783-Alexandrium_andersonii.AAC.1
MCRRAPAVERRPKPHGANEGGEPWRVQGSARGALKQPEALPHVPCCARMPEQRSGFTTGLSPSGSGT